MMKYSIRTIDSFIVSGQMVELTNSKSKNVLISTKFWQRFNQNLKKANLSQGGNWVKYAFMLRNRGKLFYYCAIEKQAKESNGFSSFYVPASKYLVVEHIGAMGEYLSNV